MHSDDFVKEFQFSCKIMDRWMPIPERSHGRYSVNKGLTKRAFPTNSDPRLLPVRYKVNGNTSQNQTDCDQRGQQNCNTTTCPKIFSNHLSAVIFVKRLIPDWKSLFVINPLGSFFKLLLAHWRRLVFSEGSKTTENVLPFTSTLHASPTSRQSVFHWK